jgi:hypothetical protein
MLRIAYGGSLTVMNDINHAPAESHYASDITRSKSASQAGWGAGEGRQPFPALVDLLLAGVAARVRAKLVAVSRGIAALAPTRSEQRIGGTGCCGFAGLHSAKCPSTK